MKTHTHTNSKISTVILYHQELQKVNIVILIKKNNFFRLPIIKVLKIPPLKVVIIRKYSYLPRKTLSKDKIILFMFLIVAWI